MQTAEMIDQLEREGQRMSAGKPDLDRTVPTCPEWTVRDLLGHTGQVNRWATEIVAKGLADPTGIDSPVVPEDAGIWEWFSDGNAALVAALRSAPADLDCWTFYPSSSPLAFWARRQAHETAVHRVDLESVGGSATPFAPAFAADGVDEVLFYAALALSDRFRTDAPERLSFGCSDVPRTWSVELGPDGATTTHAETPVDAGCQVTGSASDLYLSLWRRQPPDRLTVTGDRSIFQRFLEHVAI